MKKKEGEYETNRGNEHKISGGLTDSETRSSVERTYTVILSTSTAVKVPEFDSWIHHSGVKPCTSAPTQTEEKDKGPTYSGQPLEDLKLLRVPAITIVAEKQRRPRDSSGRRDQGEHSFISPMGSAGSFPGRLSTYWGQALRFIGLGFRVWENLRHCYCGAKGLVKAGRGAREVRP